MKTRCAHISTDKQCLAPQGDALTAVGCTEVFEDGGVSGTAARRSGLEAALARTGPGRVLVVWKLDRLGRSLPHLIETGQLPGERYAIESGMQTQAGMADLAGADHSIPWRVIRPVNNASSMLTPRPHAAQIQGGQRGRHY